MDLRSKRGLPNGKSRFFDLAPREAEESTMTTSNHDMGPNDADAGPDATGPVGQNETEEQRVARVAREAAARAVMHPDWHDTDWRYYFGAWGG
jgi:hypothetical protein